MAATNSTVKQAKTSGKVKQSGPSALQTEIQLIAELTGKSIDKYFPLLKTAPDMLYTAMAIWGLESGWRLYHARGDSRHNTDVLPERSQLIGKGYYFADPIKSLREKNPANVVLMDNIRQGFVAHGLTACMGCYHVKGTPNHRSDFEINRDILTKLETDGLGIEVDPNSWITGNPQSITGLFPNNVVGKQRSIVSGLLILQNKYRIYLTKVYPGNPVKAMEAAIGGYLGRGKDANGMTPAQRIADVQYAASSKIALLASVGIVRNGRAEVLYTPEMASLAKITPASNTVVNQGPGTVATSNGATQNLPGCIS